MSPIKHKILEKSKEKNKQYSEQQGILQYDKDCIKEFEKLDFVKMFIIE
jgi:hypothetical protein